MNFTNLELTQSIVRLSIRSQRSMKLISCCCSLSNVDLRVVNKKVKSSRVVTSCSCPRARANRKAVRETTCTIGLKILPTTMNNINDCVDTNFYSPEFIDRLTLWGVVFVKSGLAWRVEPDSVHHCVRTGRSCAARGPSTTSCKRILKTSEDKPLTILVFLSATQLFLKSLTVRSGAARSLQGQQLSVASYTLWDTVCMIRTILNLVTKRRCHIVPYQ